MIVDLVDLWSCRQWSVVAREWRPEMGAMEAGRIKKAYLKLLLAFEQHLSQHCKVEVRKVCTIAPSPLHSLCTCSASFSTALKFLTR